MRFVGALFPLLALSTLAGCSASPISRTHLRSVLAERAQVGFEPAPTPRGSSVLSFAASQVGKPYCWGGTGPRCFDCSGLVQTAWATRGGVRLPRTTGDIAARVREIPLHEVRPGDILWWPGHVGLYAGGGYMIDAYDSRHGVVQRPVTDPQRAFRPDS